MNKVYQRVALLLAFVAAFSLAISTYSQDKKTATGEDFFIVASVDQAKSQLLLKHPTEVTTLLNVNGKTRLLDEEGKTIRLSDLRTGDTLWVVSSGAGQSATAVNIRKGSMTVAELHRYYLDYPEIK
jgi:hypothetical protein